MATPTTAALALRRALDLESIPLREPAPRPGPSPLLNPRRLELLLAAAAYPGVHLRSASRLLLSPLPSLRFHVLQLVERDLLRARRFAGRISLFVPSLYRPEAEPLLVAWGSPRDRTVLEALRGHPPRSRSQLRLTLGSTQGRLDRSLIRLMKWEAVRRTGNGRSARFALTRLWMRFERQCGDEVEGRLGTFLELLRSEKLHPAVESRQGDRVRMSVAGPRGRIRFALPLNPLTRDK